MPLEIERYALVGDCETAALVGDDGSVDWLCWPSFASDACFAALLGDESHGAWSIAPVAEWTSERRYRDDTLVLETTFETADGAARVVDFMPPRGELSDLVRIIVGVRGRVTLKSRLGLRFGYGSVRPWIRRLDDGRAAAVAGPDMAVLDAAVAHEWEDGTMHAEITVSAGDRVPLVLT
jgi:GH15 family glucan-1,4-alpha-glucosidase